MFSKTKCGGVLVPDGRGDYERVCFVDRRNMPPSEKMEWDHFIPRKLWFEFPGLEVVDALAVHKVHAYCQRVQGGMLGGGSPEAAAYARSVLTSEQIVEAARMGGQRPKPPEQAQVMNEANRKSGHFIKASALGNHTRWHVRRGIRSKACSFC